MSWLTDLQTFLSGKKTIITAIVAGVDAAGTEMGWWEPNHVREIVEGTLFAVFLRMGVKSSGPAGV